MRDQEIIGLSEAYASIYTSQEEVVEETEQLDEDGVESVSRGSNPGGGFTTGKPKPAAKPAQKPQKSPSLGGPTMKGWSPLKDEVEFDTFDCILEYLVSEGFADTNENAVAIMANMSESWKQSIVEASYSDNDYRAGGGDEKRLRTNMSTVEVSRLGRENINRLIDKEPLGTKIKQKLFGREVPVPPNSNIPQNTLFYNRMLPDMRSSGRPSLHGDPLPGPRAKYYGPAR